MTDEIYSLRIPVPVNSRGTALWMNANHSYARWERARRVKAWRETTVLHARAARLPRGLERVRITALLTFETRRKRDEANYHTTLKPIIDGLGPNRSRITKSGTHISAPGHGLIPDDTPEHLDGPHIRISQVLGKPSVLLTIREVTA